MRVCFAMKVFSIHAKKDQNIVDEINFQEMEVRPPADTMHRNATSHIGTRKKNEIIHKVDF